MNNSENSGKGRRGRPFQKGQSGNPAGKPKGARSKATMLAEKLMQGDAKEVVEAVLKAAKGGDMTAARIIMDRIAPARRDNPVTFDMPKIERPADAVAAGAAILDAVANGDLTPDEAERLLKLLEGFVRMIETTELEERLKRLEERTGL
ncbi:DUF5681 domain-containing protein [Methylosinus sporium]|uniref:DUF5681 domain-containing protein n=1 Tax=Methylosinus sporium TaxID=428 RepID=UPI003839FC78